MHYLLRNMLGMVAVLMLVAGCATPPNIDAGKSGNTPSRSNNGEDLHGLGDKASDSKAQKKAAVGRTELGDAQGPIRLDA